MISGGKFYCNTLMSAILPLAAVAVKKGTLMCSDKLLSIL